MFSPSMLVKAVCLTIALGAPTAAVSLETAPDTTPTPNAPVEASQCVTVDSLVASIAATIPDAEIKSITKEPPYIIVFTSPSMPTDYAVEFDNNGCLVSAVEVSKVKA